MSTSFGSPAYEPVEGDSLTQFVRSMQNLIGGSGKGAFDTGQGMLTTGGDTIKSGLGLTTAGVPIIKGALPVFGEGQAGYQGGVRAAAPSLDYLTKLVKGDQADVNQAIAPEVARLDQQFGAIRNMISSQPRGGGKSSVLAEAPFEKAKAEAGIASTARAGASKELAQLSTQLASLGLSQEQAATVLASLGVDVSKIGVDVANIGLGEQNVALGESQTGAGLLGAALADALTRRGQNITGGTANTFSTIASGIGNLLSSII